MNLQQLTAAVARRAGIAVTDTTPYGTIPDHINEALHDLELRRPGGWDWLRLYGTVTTTADQDYLTFAEIATSVGATGGIRQIVEVRTPFGDGYEKLMRAQKRDLDESFGPLGSTSSMLRYYATEGQRLWLYPTPDDAYDLKVTVVAMEPDLETPDLDSPIMPHVYHRVLVAAAADLVLQSLGRLTDAKVQADAAEQGVRQMVYASSPTTGPGRLAGSAPR